MCSKTGTRTRVCIRVYAFHIHVIIAQRTGKRECTRCTKFSTPAETQTKTVVFSLYVYVPTPSCLVKNKCQSSLSETLSVRLTHGCIPALQQRFGVPQQQSVVWIHDVGLVLGLSFFLLRVRLVKSLLVVALVHGTLKQFTKESSNIRCLRGGSILKQPSGTEPQ